jgi:hypothetical protein
MRGMPKRKSKNKIKTRIRRRKAIIRGRLPI